MDPCVNYFWHCDKILEQNLREKNFILVHSFRGLIHHGRECMVRRAAYIMAARKQREREYL
jgi:hypothetical protein